MGIFERIILGAKTIPLGELKPIEWIELEDFKNF